MRYILNELCDIFKAFSCQTIDFCEEQIDIKPFSTENLTLCCQYTYAQRFYCYWLLHSMWLTVLSVFSNYANLLYDFRRLVIHYCSERHSKIWMFLKKLSPRLHLFDQKQYSKNNNIEKYYCFKIFSVLMHFKMSFIPVAYKAKQNFQSSVDDPSEIILICWFGA